MFSHTISNNGVSRNNKLSKTLVRIYEVCEFTEYKSEWLWVSSPTTLTAAVKVKVSTQQNL